MSNNSSVDSGFSMIAMIGALGLMAAAGGAQAAAVVGPPACPASPAFAGQLHAITSSVTDNGAGVYTYDYRVCNLSSGEDGQSLVDFELPWFDSYGNNVGTGNPILDVFAPEGWHWEIETEGDRDANSGWAGDILWNNAGDLQKAHFDDVFGGAANNPFNFHTRVLHFTTGTIEAWLDPIAPGGEREGFRIVSTFGRSPVGAPDQSSWANIEPRTGDPDLPLAGAPGSTEIQRALSVPEPGTLGLLGIGLFALLGLGRLRTAAARVAS